VSIFEPRATELWLGPASIVVAEDDVATRALLRAALQRADYEVREFDNGADALHDIHRSAPDVALLDIGMPGMDGYEVARRLRKLPGGEHALMIAVTGFGRDEDRRRSEEAGFDRHVTKPLNPRTLPSLISRDDGSERTN
jgi:CheY-like chemotaxis protein